MGEKRRGEDVSILTPVTFCQRQQPLVLEPEDGDQGRDDREGGRVPRAVEPGERVQVEVVDDAEGEGREDCEDCEES